MVTLKGVFPGTNLTVRLRAYKKNNFTSSHSTLYETDAGSVKLPLQASPYDKKSQRWNEITNAVTVYLCKDLVPFQNVDRKGFKDMVKTLDPRYALPATHTSASKFNILLNFSVFQRWK